jgi:hypothetical protein
MRAGKWLVPQYLPRRASADGGLSEDTESVQALAARCLATGQQAGTALGPAQSAGDRRSLNRALVTNADAKTAAPGERAEAPCVSVKEFEPAWQSVRLRELETCAAGR